MLNPISQPGFYPVTRGQAFAHCRVDYPTDQQGDLMDIYLAAATATAEHLTGRAFVERTYRWDLDPQSDTLPGAFPRGLFIGGAMALRSLMLPVGPVIEVDGIEFTNQAGEVTVWSSEDSPPMFRLQGDRVYLETGGRWPQFSREWIGAVSVVFTAGYPSPNPDDSPPHDSPPNSPPNLARFPGELRHWMLLRVATAWRNRESLVQGAIDELPRSHLDSLLDPLVLGKRFG